MQGLQKLYEGLQEEYYSWKIEIKSILQRAMATGNGTMIKQLASMDEPLMKLLFLYEEEARSMIMAVPTSEPASRKRLLLTPKSAKKTKDESKSDIPIGTPIIDIPE